MSSKKLLSLSITAKKVENESKRRSYTLIAWASCQSEAQGFLTLRLFWPDVVPVSDSWKMQLTGRVERNGLRYIEYRRTVDVHLFPRQKLEMVGPEADAQLVYKINAEVLAELKSASHRLYFELHLDDTELCDASKSFKSMHKF